MHYEVCFIFPHPGRVPCQYMPSFVFSSRRNKWHILVSHTTKKLDSTVPTQIP